MWLCLFLFRPITLKYLNSLTSIKTFGCIGGGEVTHQSVVRKALGSIPGLQNVCYFVCVFPLSTLFVMNFAM